MFSLSPILSLVGLAIYLLARDEGEVNHLILLPCLQLLLIFLWKLSNHLPAINPSGVFVTPFLLLDLNLNKLLVHLNSQHIDIKSTT